MSRASEASSVAHDRRACVPIADADLAGVGVLIGGRRAFDLREAFTPDRPKLVKA
jgi:hypothetical protein